MRKWRKSVVSILTAICLALALFAPAATETAGAQTLTIEEAKAALEAAQADVDAAQGAVNTARQNAENALAQAKTAAKEKADAEQGKIAALKTAADQAKADANAAKKRMDNAESEYQKTRTTRDNLVTVHNKWAEIYKTTTDENEKKAAELNVNAILKALGDVEIELREKEVAYNNAKSVYAQKAAANTAAQSALQTQQQAAQQAKAESDRIAAITVDAILSGSATAPDTATKNAVDALKKAQEKLDAAKAALAKAQSDYDRIQTIAAEDVTLTYGDTGKSITASAYGTLSYTVTEGSDVISVDAGTGAITTKKAGSAKVKIATAGDDSHDPAEKTITVTVEKAEASATVIPVYTTYNGQKQALVRNITVSGGTLMFSTDNLKTWSEEIPMAVNSGRYLISYKVLGDANHKDLGSRGFPAFIYQKDIADAVITMGDDLVWTGDEQNAPLTSVSIDGVAGDVTYNMIQGSKGHNRRACTEICDFGTRNT